MIVNDNNWFRCGSHCTYYYAIREEISQLICNFFEKDIAEYYVCGTDLLKPKGNKIYQHFAFSYDLKLLSICMKEHKNAVNYYIGKNIITPRKHLISLNSASSMSLSGLIRIQCHTYQWRNKHYSPSTIGLVYKVDNKITGEVYEHKQYKDLFKKLKIYLKKSLPYRTKFATSEFEDKSCFMSEGALKIYQAGIQLGHRPILQ
jgi:hypothetical protein